MIAALVVLAQLSAAPAYSSDALRTLVSAAVVANAAPPPALRGYRATVESELSLLLRDTLGRERATQLEQLSSAVRWQNGGPYEMHVVGYRTQGLGSPFSTLSFVRGWTEPTLYGDRLRFGAMLGPDSAMRARESERARQDTVIAVHPFAADREQYYTFSGGDTVTVLRVGARAIPIVRVHVTPRLNDSTRLAAFEGEIDLDGDRAQIVRMRGRFVFMGPPPRDRPLLSRVPGIVAVAYCEFVNTEVNGLYWLPAFQRTEMQSTIALFGRSRAVMRIVSTFSGYGVDDTSAVVVADSQRRRTTWAAQDSVSRFAEWRATIGDATSAVSADDFDDVGPEQWRPSGSPRVDFTPSVTDNIVRYDRVQGLFTGLEATLQMRSAAPGLTVGVTGGYAWTEHTMRGGVRGALQRGSWTYGARAERSLPTTNDFIRPFEAQSGGLAALTGTDNFDYVDRRLALASVTHVLGAVDIGLVTVQLGAGEDQAEPARLARGAFGGGSLLPNRGLDAGTYSLAMMDLEWHPGISGDFVQPGFGAQLHVEGARGALKWQRAQLSLSAREYVGPVSVLMEVHSGVVTGARIPPQQLFELGGSAGLTGYAYKEFVGDRAALFRGQVNYSLPLWRAPRRVWRSFIVPGFAPGLAASLQGGYTELATSSARASVQRLCVLPLPVATGNARATVAGGLSFFAGLVHVAVGRAVDRPAPWKFTFGFGPYL